MLSCRWTQSSSVLDNQSLHLSPTQLLPPNLSLRPRSALSPGLLPRTSPSTSPPLTEPAPRSTLPSHTPASTVPIILAKLPSLLYPLPPSVHRIIVHVGCVDASHRQSEITKGHFNKLLQFLNSTGKSIFISGPLSPHRGKGIFSRILSLHTWLQTACRTHNVGFIDNFNIFWRRPSLLKADGFHPNKLGSRILAANVQLLRFRHTALTYLTFHSAPWRL
uniref:SGNH hydrolase-type esterase domain-containing protein n=1 Tax=Hippocampus comes TaxID=109280 RepID=A0A3Q2Z4S7_HIPCM